MFNDYNITMESFVECPANWEAIADYLNEIIETYVAEATTTDEDGIETVDEITLRDRIDALWEAYWSGDLADAPKPSTELWEDA